MTQPTIRVCNGTEPKTEIPRKVLEFSIRKHAAKGRPIQFVPLSGGDWHGTGPLQQYTGFSLLRWTIPELLDFAGKAIYLDADQLCWTDIAKLWDVADERGACVWCTRYEYRPKHRLLPFGRTRRVLPESSVMLIDCHRAKNRLPTLEHIRRDLTEQACARFSTSGARPDGMHPYWHEQFVGTS